MAREAKHDMTQVIVWNEGGVEKRCVPSPNQAIESAAKKSVPAGVKWWTEPKQPHGRKAEASFTSATVMTGETSVRDVGSGEFVVSPLPDDATVPQITEKLNELVRALSNRG